MSLKGSSVLVSQSQINALSLAHHLANFPSLLISSTAYIQLHRYGDGLIMHEATEQPSNITA